MIILDTCALIFDALFPEKLSRKATQIIKDSTRLYCSDISLWEIAMLIAKKRLSPGTDTETFLQLILQAHPLEVLAITPEIAALSVNTCFKHHDPADRIIAATAIYHNFSLITCDKHLFDIPSLTILW
jgi:PIN domain nuclease of toxin-antitoxin system